MGLRPFVPSLDRPKRIIVCDPSLRWIKARDRKFVYSNNKIAYATWPAREETMRVNNAFKGVVHGVHASETLAQAVTLMLRSHACALSIFADDSSIVGVMIEGDLKEHREREIEKHRAQWKEFLFGQVKRMLVHINVDCRCFVETKTSAVTTFSEVENLWAVFALMKRNNIRRLPVMMGDRLLGILVGADLIGVWTLLTPASDHPASDANMRNSILAALGHWGQASRPTGGADARRSASEPRAPDQAAYGGHKADCGLAPMLLGNQKHVEIRPKRAPNVGKQKINGVERERVEAPFLGSINQSVPIASGVDREMPD